MERFSVNRYRNILQKISLEKGVKLVLNFLRCMNKVCALRARGNMFPINYRTCQSRTNLNTRDSVKRTYQERVIKLIIAPYGILVVLCL
jgi:hypothetical protein